MSDTPVYIQKAPARALASKRVILRSFRPSLLPPPPSDDQPGLTACLVGARGWKQSQRRGPEKMSDALKLMLSSIGHFPPPTRSRACTRTCARAPPNPTRQLRLVPEPESALPSVDRRRMEGCGAVADPKRCGPPSSYFSVDVRTPCTNCSPARRWP